MMARVSVQSTNFNSIFGGNQYGLANRRKNTYVKLVSMKNISNWRTQLLAPSIIGSSSSNKAFNNNSVVNYYSSLDFDFDSDSSSTPLGQRRGIRCVAKAASPLEHFTETSYCIVTTFAQEEARRMGHNYVDTGHILLGIIAQDTGIGAKVLKAMGINLIDARREVEKIIGRGKNIGVVDVEMRITRRARRVFEISLEKALELGHTYVESEHLLLGLLHEGEVEGVLVNPGADQNTIYTQVFLMVRKSLEIVGANVGGVNTGNKMSTLEGLGTNLTKLASEGKLDPLAGWQQQIEYVTKSLVSHTNYNICLIGESGVGKTAIVEGLAQMIANGDVPKTIQEKKVIRLDMGLLVGGTKSHDELDETLKKLMEEINQSKKVILFMDEVHALIGIDAAEGTIAATNMLKQARESGELQCIVSTTHDEFRKHIEKNPVLLRQFKTVKVPEHSVDETIQILKALRERFEIRHKLRYTDEAVVAAAKLSYQYIRDHFLPDEAIYVIDRAGSRVQRHNELLEEARELEKELKQISDQKNEAIRDHDLEKAGKLSDREIDLRAQITNLVKKVPEKSKGESKADNLGPIVTDIDVQHIVSSRTGIPAEKISSDNSDRLLELEESLHTMLINMEEALHVRLIGQDEAVKALSYAVCRERSVLKNPNRPIASFIFSGPTGIGKSELAKALASCYFGFEEAMILVDMSDFMERPIISKLSGLLTEAVCRQPYTVVLFDVIEMAHPDVFNIILQIMEDGRLTDSYGHTVDFKNTIIIMTSTVGSNSIQKGGYNEKDSSSSSSSYNRITSVVREELKRYFRPELLNLLDEIIVFKPLTKLELKDIAVEIVKEVSARVQEKENIRSLDVAPCFIDMVVDQDYDMSYGKRRTLRREIARHLEESVAEKMLTGEIQVGDAVTVLYDRQESQDGDVVFLSLGRNEALAVFAFLILVFLCFFFFALFVYWLVSRVFRWK